MELQLFESICHDKIFRIEGEFPVVGAYLFIFNNDRSKCLYDYMQDDVEMCLRFAEKYFNVSRDSWIKLPADTETYCDVEVEMSWRTLEK